MSLHERLKQITFVVLDIDGVLTDGRVGYGCGSDEEIKFFDVKDGKGINLLKEAGVRVCVLSGRISRANRVRLDELGIGGMYEGYRDKAAGLDNVAEQEHIQRSECLYMGDDLMDIPAMRRAGASVAPADAVSEAQQVADWCTHSCGGEGAVREMAEQLLKSQDKWEKVIQPYVSF